MPFGDQILRGALAGVLAGFMSGLLGVSPGGILVAVITLTLGFPEHLAQAVSLVAQAPPTSLAAVSDYSRRGRSMPFRWVLILSIGFIAGSIGGAILARFIDDRVLRWMFVGYLLILVAIATLRNPHDSAASGEKFAPRALPVLTLLAIGIAAGASSGLLGIGGGLAITALAMSLLRVDQHRAQALSLAVTAMPLTLPAAWVYARQGWLIPWWAVAGIIVGLAVGSKIGGMAANHLSAGVLRRYFVVLLLALAAYMAWLAYRH